jgi:hypothetical protein
MKEKKFLRHLAARRNNNYPLHKKREVSQNPDLHSTQDFPGYPHAMSSLELINPKTNAQKKTAGVGKKDGEKTDQFKKKSTIKTDEQDNGSGTAFENTEKVVD